MDWYEELLQAATRPAEPRADRPDVTASELAEFTFCGRAWWLRRETGPPAEASAALENGERRHALAGQAIRIAEAFGTLERIALWAVVGAGVLAMVIVAWLLGGRG